MSCQWFWGGGGGGANTLPDSGHHNNNIGMTEGNDYEVVLSSLIDQFQIPIYELYGLYGKKHGLGIAVQQNQSS